jgi:predicted transcriptional regulator
VNATDGDPESAINALRLGVTRYLELNSDEVVITKLLRMPDVAVAMKNKKRAA